MRVIHESRRPPKSSMRPQVIIHFLQGKPIKVRESPDTVTAGMLTERPFAVTRVTDHGSEKRVIVRSGAIMRIEEA
jgi:hypothetical protein